MRKWMTIVLFAMAVPALTLAQTGGMMGGGMMGGGMMGGAGMVAVADDGSVLVVVGGVDEAGALTAPVLVSLGPDGAERWTLELDQGWPVQVVTSGEYVFAALTGYSADSASGEGEWPWGQGGMWGGQQTLMAIDLATGLEMWQTQLDGLMGGSIELAPDNARLYVVTGEHQGEPGQMGQGSMGQGDAGGMGWGMTTTLRALDPANGDILWTIELGNGAGMYGGDDGATGGGTGGGHMGGHVVGPGSAS